VIKATTRLSAPQAKLTPEFMLGAREASLHEYLSYTRGLEERHDFANIRRRTESSQSKCQRIQALTLPPAVSMLALDIARSMNCGYRDL